MNLNPFAAVYDFWMGIPEPMRVQIAAGAKSARFTANTAAAFVITDAIADGAYTSNEALLAWMKSRWLLELLAFMYGSGVASTARVKDAQKMLANSFTTPDGQRAYVLPASAPPAAPPDPPPPPPKP